MRLRNIAALLLAVAMLSGGVYLILLSLYDVFSNTEPNIILDAFAVVGGCVFILVGIIINDSNVEDIYWNRRKKKK